MKEKDYIKGLEDQIEELQQKLGALSGNVKLIATIKMSDAFKPEKQIHLNAYVRIIKGEKMVGSQVEVVNIAVATKKNKYWQVNHNEVKSYQIKKNTDDVHEVIAEILDEAGYAHAPYETIDK
jgi:hypothetical protein